MKAMVVPRKGGPDVLELRDVPEPTAGEPGGWGLFLTEQLADRWGIDRDGGWTTVWLERDLDSLAPEG